MKKKYETAKATIIMLHPDRGDVLLTSALKGIGDQDDIGWLPIDEINGFTIR